MKKAVAMTKAGGGRSAEAELTVPVTQLEPETARLIGRLKVSGWVILILLILFSLLLDTSPKFIAGVALGAVISVMGFYHLYSFSFNFLSRRQTAPRAGFFLSYPIRLVVVALLIFPALWMKLVDPVGLIIGLSATVINLFTVGVFLMAGMAKREMDTEVEDIE